MFDEKFTYTRETYYVVDIKVDTFVDIQISHFSNTTDLSNSMREAGLKSWAETNIVVDVNFFAIFC